MIDLERIEQIKLMPLAAARTAMKEYAAELGVTTKARTIDNMVSEMGAQLNKLLEDQIAATEDAVGYDANVPEMVSIETHGFEVEPVSIIQPRAKALAVLPKAINPIKGRGFMFYAMPSNIADVDECTFRWQHKSTAGGAIFTDIPNATDQKYKVDVSDDVHLGEYQCIIREADGTETTTTATSKVETLAALPAGFPMINLYEAKWIDFYGCSFAHVRWGGIYRMQKILADDTTNSNTSLIHRTMDEYKESVPLLDLISNTTFLVATDSRDGYRYLISSDTNKDTPIKIIGRFNKND